MAPTKITHPVEIIRKNPKQIRAGLTFGTILDTAAQILQADGEAGLTTNKIAEKSGYSIGTLYQYFANKDAIIAALVERERDQIAKRITNEIQAARPEDLQSAARSVIHALVQTFEQRRRARRIVMIKVLLANGGDPLTGLVDQIGQLIASRINTQSGGRIRKLSEASVYVLTRAVLGSIRAAVIEDSPILADPEFENELVRLALVFLEPVEG